MGRIEAHGIACPGCGATTRTTRGAVVSPWIRKRAEIRARRTRLGVCDRCGTGMFEYRYSDEELDRIYVGYRGLEYFNLRHAWEPSYTREMNEDLGEGHDVVGSRRRALSDLLEAQVQRGASGLECAIDIGGDVGQFIPEEIPRRYVLDVSGKEVRPGVVAIADPGDERAHGTDIVMMCGILEHLPRPDEFISASLRDVRWGSHRLLYAEVPAGVPTANVRGLSRAALPVGLLSSMCRPTWRMADRVNARSQRRGRPWSLMPLRLSEHLNFFTTEGLTALVERCGGRVLLCDEYDIASSLTRSGRLSFSRTLRLLAEMDTGHG